MGTEWGKRHHMLIDLEPQNKKKNTKCDTKKTSTLHSQTSPAIPTNLENKTSTKHETFRVRWLKLPREHSTHICLSVIAFLKKTAPFVSKPGCFHFARFSRFFTHEVSLCSAAAEFKSRSSASLFWYRRACTSRLIRKCNAKKKIFQIQHILNKAGTHERLECDFFGIRIRIFLGIRIIYIRIKRESPAPSQLESVFFFSWFLRILQFSNCAGFLLHWLVESLFSSADSFQLCRIPESYRYFCFVWIENVLGIKLFWIVWGFETSWFCPDGTSQSNAHNLNGLV